MIKAGVVGYPVKHSLSPKIHGYWLAQLAIEGAYDLYEIAPENFADFLASLPEKGMVGVNVTVPFKEQAFQLVDSLSSEAEAIGAVNTIIVQEDGTLHGHNTDAFGFIENIRQSVPSFAFKGKKALVLGAGGAAKAVVTGLLNEGVEEILLTNRTKARAELFQKDRVTIVDWQEKGQTLAQIDLLVNTTVLGMQGQPPLDISLENLSSQALVTDIVYKPLETELLVAAKQRGNSTVDGLGMLLYQAVAGFNAWFGKQPQVTDILKEILLKDV